MTVTAISPIQAPVAIPSPRVAVVGAGWAGEFVHTRGYQAGGAEVVAIADVDEGRARDLAGRYGVERAYGDWRRMLEVEQPDAVSVAVPNTMHEELTVAALESGAHVLCEKPIASTVAAAQRMFDTARTSKRWLMAAQQYRWAEGAMAIKKAIDAGELGHIYYAEATALRRLRIPGRAFIRRDMSGGGPLFDVGVHMLDQAIWLMGNPQAIAVSATIERQFGDRPEVAAVSGGYDPADFDVEDFAVAFVRLEGGATLFLRASWAAHLETFERMQARLVGTEGGATVEPPVIHRLRDGKPIDEAFTRLPQTNAYTLELAHFLAVVRGETEPLVREEETMNVQRILNAAYESAELGREVRLAS
jgi:predicted dehydrogenase